MKMDNEKLQELAAAYSLGMLEDDEREVFENLIKSGDPDAIAQLKAMQEVVTVLPMAAEPVAPPAFLKSKIMAEIEAEAIPEIAETPATSYREDSRFETIVVEQLREMAAFWRRLTWGVAIASLVIIVGVGIYSIKLKQDVQYLEKQVEIGGSLINNLETELKRKNEFLTIVQDASVKVFALNGLEAAPKASATVFLSADEKKAVFSAQNLGDLATGKDYQLWMLKGNQPVDAGLLTAENGHFVATFAVDFSLDELSAFAVTVEPKGGVPQPTGTMVLLGTTSGS